MNDNKSKKKYTSDEAIEMATNAVRSMGLSEFYEKQIAAAEKRGYQKAIEDMQAKLNKMFL